MSNGRTRSEWLADYEDYRAAYGYKNLCDDAIHLFLRWCERNYPDDAYFTQEMIDLWGARRDTETDWTHSGRAAALNGLLRYINERGGGPFRLLEYNWAAGSPEPVLFTQEELENFFRAVDEYTPHDHPRSRRTALCSRLNAIQLPVLFRLLYSSGIRINEGRWLHREDVDLERGVLYIRRTKGYIERLVALHPTMTALLREYEAKIRELMPDAVPYFPSNTGEYHHKVWLNKYFRMFWYKYNPRPAPGERSVVPYALRHNYAVENISGWHQDGYNADKRLVALSRSMGHVYIQSTQYYFHLVPKFADIMEDVEGTFINSIMPEVDL